MKFITNISCDVNENEWDEVLSNSKYSTAFQTACYNKPSQLTFQSKLFFITVQNENKEILGQLSLELKTKNQKIVGNFFVRNLFNTFSLGTILIWKQGPIIHSKIHENEILEEILNAVDKISKENKVYLIRGSSSPLADYSLNSIFKKFGYSCKEWKTYVIDLNVSPEQYFSSLDKSTRYDIRKGEKNGFTFEISKERSDLEDLSYLKLQNKNGIDKIMQRGKLYNDNNWNIVFKKGYRKIFSVKKNGKLFGVIMNSIFNKNVGQNTVVNSSERESTAGSFLTFNTIKYFIEKGCTTYDLGGSNPSPESFKEQGIDFYKSKWGGKELRLTNYSKTLTNSKIKFLKFCIDTFKKNN